MSINLDDFVLTRHRPLGIGLATRDGELTFPRDDPRHGTLNGYNNLRCRCLRCRGATREAHRVYMSEHPEQRLKSRERTRRSRRVDPVAGGEAGC